MKKKKKKKKKKKISGICVIRWFKSAKEFI
jgi:hypothetical protein